MENNDEIKVEGTQENGGAAENAGAEIVVAEGGKVKKILKWVIGGVALVATAVSGILLGKHLGKDDEDDSETAENESPEE